MITCPIVGKLYRFVLPTRFSSPQYMNTTLSVCIQSTGEEIDATKPILYLGPDLLDDNLGILGYFFLVGDRKVSVKPRDRLLEYLEELPSEQDL